MAGNSNLIPLIYGLLAAFSWGTHGIIIRYLSSDMNGLTSATLRLYIGALTLFVILKIRGHTERINIKDRSFLLITLALAVNFVLFHVGLDDTSASNAVMLENTAPIFVVIFLFVIFREKVRLMEGVAVIATVIGVYLTVRHDLEIGGKGLLGDGIEILAGVTWAIFMMMSSRWLSTSSGALERINYLFYIFLGAALMLTPFTFFYPFSIDGNDVVWLLVLGIFPTAIGYYLWYEAAARVSTITASLLFTLTVIFTFINAAIFLGEEMTVDMISGAVLIVIGIVVSRISAARK
ncbi:MAG: DMT family transporter [Stappiaceae bacterium]